MFRDIILPRNNEEKFIEIASKLGYKKLYFLYDFDNFNQENTQKNLTSFENPKNINIEIGFIVNQKNINQSFKQSKLLVVKSSDKDRFFIESKKIRMIYGFEEEHKNDYLHQRASGLNHVICELAKKNNVAVGFSYSSLFNKGDQTTPLLLGRMMQNISLCQKYKVKTIIGSFSENPFGMRSPHDVISLFNMLGMDRKKVKESVTLDV
ncbi:hypothetical protein HYX00_06055 [Candidatus Woesearchaeota archaeon]|nr:hypothetical protein [Candidatus Woesearchaeota archaeon]